MAKKSPDVTCFPLKSFLYGACSGVVRFSFEIAGSDGHFLKYILIDRRLCNKSEIITGNGRPLAMILNSDWLLTPIAVTNTIALCISCKIHVALTWNVIINQLTSLPMSRQRSAAVVPCANSVSYWIIRIIITAKKILNVVNYEHIEPSLGSCGVELWQFYTNNLWHFSHSWWHLASASLSGSNSLDRWYWNLNVCSWSLGCELKLI